MLVILELLFSHSKLIGGLEGVPVLLDVSGTSLLLLLDQFSYLFLTFFVATHIKENKIVWCCYELCVVDLISPVRLINS